LDGPLVDALEFISKSHPSYDKLKSYLVSFIENIIKYQKNGYFYWQLGALDSYVDTSATAMIGYAIKKGITIGLIDKKYENVALNALDAIIKSTKNGIIGDCSGECRGLSMYPQVYSSYPWSQGPGTALYSLSVQ